jgi:hypothetical protein
MKTQAWGWLAAGVVALGLNGFYQDGGLGWAHRMAESVEENTSKVWALASGHADRFVALAQLMNARTEAASGSVESAIARVQSNAAVVQSKWADVEKISAQQEVGMARAEARCARVQERVERANARMQARTAARVSARAMATNIMIPAVAAVRAPEVCGLCPRLANLPRLPIIRTPMVRTPVIRVSLSDAGPI